MSQPWGCALRCTWTPEKGFSMNMFKICSSCHPSTEKSRKKPVQPHFSLLGHIQGSHLLITGHFFLFSVPKTDQLWSGNLQAAFHRAAALPSSIYTRYFSCTVCHTRKRGDSLVKVLTSLGAGFCAASTPLAISPALPLKPAQHWQVSLLCTRART